MRFGPFAEFSGFFAFSNASKGLFCVLTLFASSKFAAAKQKIFLFFSSFFHLFFFFPLFFCRVVAFLLLFSCVVCLSLHSSVTQHSSALIRIEISPLFLFFPFFLFIFFFLFFLSCCCVFASFFLRRLFVAALKCDSTFVSGEILLFSSFFPFFLLINYLKNQRQNESLVVVLCQHPYSALQRHSRNVFPVRVSFSVGSKLAFDTSCPSHVDMVRACELGYCWIPVLCHHTGRQEPSESGNDQHDVCTIHNLCLPDGRDARRLGLCHCRLRSFGGALVHKQKVKLIKLKSKEKKMGLWSLLWQLPVVVGLLEVLARAVVHFLFPRHIRLRSAVESHNLSILASAFKFNMCGVLVVQSELGPHQHQRFVAAAEALARNVPLLARDASGCCRLPFVVVPGRPTSVRVQVRPTEANNLQELEALAKAEMEHVLGTRWRDEWSPFAVSVLCSHAGLVALVFSADHRILDGSSVIELARRYLLLLADRDPGPIIPAIIPSSIEDRFPLLPWAVPYAVKMMLGAWALFRVTKGFQLQSLNAGNFGGSRNPADLIGPGSSVVSYATVSADSTAAILNRARAEGVPFSSLLAAATCRALGRAAAKPSSTGSKSFALLNLVDHRRLGPLSEPYPMGNLASTLEVTDDYDAVMSNTASLFAVGHRFRARAAGISLWDVLTQMCAWQCLFVPVYGPVFRDMFEKFRSGRHDNFWTNAVVSNLGLLVEPVSNGGERRRQSSTALISASDYRHIPPILRFFGAASSVSPFAQPIVYASTVDSSLCLTVCGHAVSFSQTRLDELTLSIVSILKEACD